MGGSGNHSPVNLTSTLEDEMVGVNFKRLCQGFTKNTSSHTYVHPPLRRLWMTDDGESGPGCFSWRWTEWRAVGSCPFLHGRAPAGN